MVLQISSINSQNLSTYSACIWITPYLRNSTSISTWSSFSDRHRDIKITGNTMNEGYNFLAARGPVLDFKIRTILVNNNTINKIGGSTIPAYCINTFQVDSFSFIGNTLTQDSLHATTYYGTYFYYTNGVRANNNTINFFKGNTTSTTNYGIYCYGYNFSNDALPTEFMFRKNDFNWKTSPIVTTTTSNTFYGISMNYPYIYNSGTAQFVRNTVIVDSNTIVNDTIQGSGVFYGFYVYNTNAAPTPASAGSKQFIRNKLYYFLK